MTKPKKILRVISSMDPKSGGPCQGIRNSIPALKSIGVDNEVVCLDAPDADYLGADDFTIHALGAAQGPWAYNKNLIPWLVKNASNYDAIIIHGLWLFNSYAVYKALKRLAPKTQNPVPSTQNPVPYYVMPHGMLDPYFQKAPERRLKAIRNWVFWKFIEGKVVNNAKGVLFTCQEELVLARQAFSPYRPKLELNVGYGIQSPPEFISKMTTEFYEKCPYVIDRPYLLFLSRIHQKKGVDLLLEAYKRCLDEADFDLDLVIAGPGLETDYGKSLFKTVSEHPNLKSRVHFTGMLSGDAKWGAFYNADAFILPSHQENFGIAVVEALACGTPVLISDKVNIWREIKNGNGGLVEKDNLKGTTNLLLNWATLTADEKTTMAQNAKKTFFEHYAIQPAAKRLVELLKESLESA